MSSSLTFEFIINKENNTVTVKREFLATLELVWKAWTTPEIIDQWWAPKPWRAETKSLDFCEGGFWLYAMVGPDNQRHWGRQDYAKIVFQKSFSGTDAFCDDNGNINPELPKTFFENEFSKTNGKTLVTITSKYASPEMLEKIIEMGFKEGFTMALENLDHYLEAQRNTISSTPLP
jgi:PhnB protein